MTYLAQIQGVPQPSNLSGFKFWTDSSIGTGRNYADLLGLVVSRLILFAIIGAGLFFFVRLISAGYSYLTSLGDSVKIQSATKELTNAVVGLLIIISAFFLAQILEVVFGINILTNP